MPVSKDSVFAPTLCRGVLMKPFSFFQEQWHQCWWRWTVWKCDLDGHRCCSKTLVVTDLKKMVRYRTYPVHSPVSAGEWRQGGEAAAAAAGGSVTECVCLRRWVREINSRVWLCRWTLTRLTDTPGSGGRCGCVFRQRTKVLRSRSKRDLPAAAFTVRRHLHFNFNNSEVIHSPQLLSLIIPVQRFLMLQSSLLCV